jgi:hypothetical protein
MPPGRPEAPQPHVAALGVRQAVRNSTEPVRTCYSEATRLSLDRLSPVGPAVELLPEEIAAAYNVVANKGAGINDYVACDEAHSVGTSWEVGYGAQLQAGVRGFVDVRLGSLGIDFGRAVTLRFWTRFRWWLRPCRF